MNNFEITSVAGKSVKLDFSTVEEANEFCDKMELFKTKGYPMWVESDVKVVVYEKSMNIINRLLHTPKLIESNNINDKIEGSNTILDAIEHIEWLNRFFYPIILVGKE